jgi:STE24 endopeptidase
MMCSAHPKISRTEFFSKTNQILGFFMMWFIPNFIMPLFNKFEPVKDEPLRKKIEELAAQLKFPLYKLFEVDGSRRSAHSNVRGNT